MVFIEIENVAFEAYGS